MRTLAIFGVDVKPCLFWKITLLPKPGQSILFFFAAKKSALTDTKARYSEFCHLRYVPVHLQPWWLDAVCGPEAWAVALSMDKSGQIVGAFPYQQTRRWGLPVVQLPMFSTYAGPWIHYPDTLKASARLSFEHKVMADLLAQMPRVVFFRQNFRPEIKNWLPFYWQGFRQTTRYTYVFDELDDLKKIMAGFKNTLRSDLKKAHRQVETRREDAAWAEVFALNSRSFARKNKHQPYTLAVFERLHNALQQRQQSAVWMARDRTTGRPSAGLYLVFDARQAAILLMGTQPALKFQGGINALLWEAIRFCAQRSLSLDFEGSMDPKIHRHFRAFGARLVPYFQVWKWWVGGKKIPSPDGQGIG